MGGRIPAIEGLRAYLAWWVVAFHTLTTVWYRIPDLPMPVELLSVGGHAVTVFMILSGFVIFRLLDLKREPYPTYILRRFLRIYPVFAASGAAMGLFLLMFGAGDPDGLVMWPLGTLERYLIHWDNVLGNLPVHLMLNAAMLQGVPSDSVLPSSGFGFNPVAWSLSLEWQFYLVAPLLFLLWRIRTYGPALLGLVVVAIFGSSAFVGPHMYPSFLPTSILWFAFGMLSWVLYRDRDKPGTLRALVIAAAAMSGVALILCLGLFREHRIVGSANVALPAAIWLVFLSLLLFRERTDGIVARVFRALFEGRTILVLGECSYSTYLWHRVIVWLVMIGMAEMLDSADPWTLVWAGTPLIVPLVLAVSLASYRYIEMPPIAFARRLARQPLALATPGATAG